MLTYCIYSIQPVGHVGFLTSPGAADGLTLARDGTHQRTQRQETGPLGCCSMKARDRNTLSNQRHPAPSRHPANRVHRAMYHKTQIAAPREPRRFIVSQRVDPCTGWGTAQDTTTIDRTTGAQPATRPKIGPARGAACMTRTNITPLSVGRVTPKK
jgi:hypothetical protein